MSLQATRTAQAVPASRVSLREKLAYAAGDVGSNLVLAPITAFLIFYLTDVAGIGAAIAGTIILIGQLLNGIIDLIVGYFIDRTNTRWGKTRPWILFSAVPLTVTFILLFSVPAGLDAHGKAIWTLIMYALVMAIFFTASNVAYGALLSVMTPSPKTRISLGAFRFFAAILTTLVVSALTLPMIQALGGGQAAWTTTAIIYGVIATVTLLLVFFGTKERVRPGRNEESSARQPIRILLGSLVRNRYFWVIFAIGALFWVYQSITSASGIYYATVILGDPSLFSILSIAGLIPTLILMPFMPRLMARFGKRSSFLGASVLLLMGSLLPLAAPENVGVVVAGLLLRGVGFAPFAAGLYAATADVIDYGEWRFGVRTDGLIFSGITIGIKVGSGLGAAAVGWALAAGGYDALANTQTAQASQSIIALYILIPLVVTLLIGLTTLLFRVERHQSEVDASLGRHAEPDTTNDSEN
jgi:GPH family glycoside/pentoside/hexuronide:cation symporter